MKVYISQIGEWDYIFDTRVWAKEKDAHEYVARREKEIIKENPNKYEHSLWTDVDGPFEVE